MYAVDGGRGVGNFVVVVVVADGLRRIVRLWLGGGWKRVVWIVVVVVVVSVTVGLTS
jgi:hypothetical protein